MPMDEVIRGIERMDSENLQDLLDAVVARYQQLNPDYTLALISLPRNDREERSRQLRKTVELLENM